MQRYTNFVNMSTIGERIFEVKNHFFGDDRGSNKKFADAIGVNPNVVSNWFARKDGIGNAVIEKILEAFPGVNKGWLVGGNGSMLNKGGDPKGKEVGGDMSDYETWLLPQTAHGGSLTEMPADGVLMQNCERIISPIKGVDFAITVYGDSMAPEYPSGSRVLIKRVNPEVFLDWGKAYVLDTSNGVIIKEVLRSPRDGFVTCHSINPDPKYADFDVPLSEVYGIYRVLMCMAAK